MAFISLMIVSIVILISAIGSLACVIGIVFLITYFIKKKKKRNKFLIISIILLCIGIPMICVLPGFKQVTNYFNNVSIDSRVNPEKFPVTNAIEKHDNKKLVKLLKNGGNANEKYEGRTALFTACANFNNGVNYDAVKILISYGADIHALSDDGYSLLKEILLSTMRYDDQNDIYNIVELLIENNYDVGQTDEDLITMLMYVVTMSRYDDEISLANKITALFIDNGANVNSSDNMGRTVLMWACGSRKVEVYNKNIATIPNTNKSQFAPFNYDLIKMLIDNGADVTVKDKNGYTALDYFKQTMENDEDWGYYNTIGKTEDYQNECAAIEKLLQ